MYLQEIRVTTSSVYYVNNFYEFFSCGILFSVVIL